MLFISIGKPESRQAIPCFKHFRPFAKNKNPPSSSSSSSFSPPTRILYFWLFVSEKDKKNIPFWARLLAGGSAGALSISVSILRVYLSISGCLPLQGAASCVVIAQLPPRHFRLATHNTHHHLPI
jgi:hypothetical protein